MFLNNSIHDDMKHYVGLFLEGREKHGRNLSFDHCYKFFQDNYRNKYARGVMALHLFAYLASWGMLRKSFLLYKDYTFLIGVIDILASSKKKDYTIAEILDIKKRIISYFKEPEGEPTTYLNKKGEKVYVSKRYNWGTLTSKILMGTLGCVPAYDDFFRGVAKQVFKINYNFNETSLNNLMAFKNKHLEVIKEIQRLTKEKCKVAYPEMKIIDMYFWQKGYSEGISINTSRVKSTQETK